MWPAGACDGIFDPTRGYIMRGGREMEDHFECLWDLFRSIPSLEKPGASVLDEFYWLNKHDPNYLPLPGYPSAAGRTRTPTASSTSARRAAWRSSSSL